MRNDVKPVMTGVGNRPVPVHTAFAKHAAAHAPPAGDRPQWPVLSYLARAKHATRQWWHHEARPHEAPPHDAATEDARPFAMRLVDGAKRVFAFVNAPMDTRAVLILATVVLLLAAIAMAALYVTWPAAAPIPTHLDEPVPVEFLIE